MSKIRLTLACWDYDRTRALIDGRIKPEGIDLNYIPMWIEETFYRMLNNKEFDASEMSLSSYTTSLFRDNPPFIAIPIFPSRTFRHRSIYINMNAGIREPKDLAGKRIGLNRYRQTAGVWIRGILQDMYHVPVSSPTYYVGGLEIPEIESKFWGAPGPRERLTNPKIQLKDVGESKTLSKMLEEGEIDALYSARMPSSFVNGSKKVGRLFPKYREEEKAYFEKTHIIPIMHTIAIKREVYEGNRWIALSLFKAFLEAKNLAYKENYQTGALKYMLPWLTDEIEELTAIAGSDYWPYGYHENLETLNTFLRYSYEQGLSERQLEPKELFAPETLEYFRRDTYTP